MSLDDSFDLDTEEHVSIPHVSSHPFSPSFHRHSSLPSPSPKPPDFPLSSLLRCTLDFTSLGAGQNLAVSEAAIGFDQDFDQHCRRIACKEELPLTYAQLREILVDMHLVNPLVSAGKQVMVQFWEVLVRPETDTVRREDVKRALKAVLGIIAERRAEWTPFLRTFQSFTTNRLRYLNLQVHAIASSLPPPSESPRKSLKPLLPLGRNPAYLLKSKQGLSPLRIPEARSLLATVKVNLTPQKFDVINVFRGDSMQELAERFIEKHGLSPCMTSKLRTLIETRLQGKTNSLD